MLTLLAGAPSLGGPSAFTTSSSLIGSLALADSGPRAPSIITSADHVNFTHFEKVRSMVMGLTDEPYVHKPLAKVGTLAQDVALLLKLFTLTHFLL